MSADFSLQRGARVRVAQAVREATVNDEYMLTVVALLLGGVVSSLVVVSNCPASEESNRKCSSQQHAAPQRLKLLQICRFKL